MLSSSMVICIRFAVTSCLSGKMLAILRESMLPVWEKISKRGRVITRHAIQELICMGRWQTQKKLAILINSRGVKESRKNEKLRCWSHTSMQGACKGVHFQFYPYNFVKNEAISLIFFVHM